MEATEVASILDLMQLSQNNSRGYTQNFRPPNPLQLAIIL
jgi:hypothetical protein